MNAKRLATDEPPIISAAGVRKSYGRGDSLVLRGVEVEVRRGECVFLAGPSGSGKSTLLSILGCILTPDEGEVRVQGVDIGRLNEVERAQLRRDRIGFVFQRFQLIRGLTALENVSVPLTLRGQTGAAAQSRSTRLLERVGLGAKLHAYPQRMSAGQCQRVALARALAGDPDLILADEPTASLDAANGQEVMELLRELTAGSGKAAVVVTHDHRIFQYADRVLHLDNGRIRDEAAERVETEMCPIPIHDLCEATSCSRS